MLIELALALDLYNSQSVSSKVEENCLIEAMMYEASGEGVEGMRVVYENIIHRTNDTKHYPNDVCAVVRQKAGKYYQYSFNSDKHKQKKKTQRTLNMAVQVLYSYKFNGMPFLTESCFKNYLNPSKVKRIPNWVSDSYKMMKVGNHDLHCLKWNNK